MADYTTYPLTVFDQIFSRSSFVTGWLVEGQIDRGRLAAALETLTTKWRMLAGRLVRTTDKVSNSITFYSFQFLCFLERNVLRNPNPPRPPPTTESLPDILPNHLYIHSNTLHPVFLRNIRPLPPARRLHPPVHTAQVCRLGRQIPPPDVLAPHLLPRHRPDRHRLLPLARHIRRGRRRHGR